MTENAPIRTNTRSEDEVLVFTNEMSLLTKLKCLVNIRKKTQMCNGKTKKGEPCTLSPNTQYCRHHKPKQFVLAPIYQPGPGRSKKMDTPHTPMELDLEFDAVQLLCEMKDLRNRIKLLRHRQGIIAARLKKGRVPK